MTLSRKKMLAHFFLKSIKFLKLVEKRNCKEIQTNLIYKLVNTHSE